MRKVYKINGDLCANCAAKIEDRIKGIEGVNKASVNFMMLKFTLDAQDDRFEAALEESLRAFSDIEPDCEVFV